MQNGTCPTLTAGRDTRLAGDVPLVQTRVGTAAADRHADGATHVGLLHAELSTACFTDLCRGFPTGQNVTNVGVKISCSMEILSGPWGGGAANARCSAPTLRRKRGVQHNTRRVTRLREPPLNRFLCDSVLPLHDKLARVINTALPGHHSTRAHRGSHRPGHGAAMQVGAKLCAKPRTQVPALPGPFETVLLLI